ncbi:M61 family metallopeptidase [Candidatus Nitrosacidococcus tergens]|uniref:Peptidase M61 domain protein n=1 Tax=Candidatus Nitrosacidococcus tergens TaxID=553981 RepID=A0A7G1QA89_9GAMM|nr:PDZ domain-containing protein [Candidatus Nitrosacidococcus tergens]CAB1275848.1 Peptidase M61 domain protein [Candidatus Nitrosacidococcus tergens]
MADIHYHIYPKNLQAHLFEITLTILKPDPEGQKLLLPAWIPGSYLIRDFAKHVIQLKAESQGQLIAIEKIDKSTWQCIPVSAPLRVIYEVYAWDDSVRTAYLDTFRGFFNGSSVFLQVTGQENQPCEITISPPIGESYSQWKVATAFQTAGAKPYDFGNYQADNYEELIDHPVEMGQFSLATFQADGVPHDIVISGHHRTDMDRLCKDLKILCEHHIRFFGEPAPMKRYVFLIRATGDSYGGLEHRASSALICNRDHLPQLAGLLNKEGYRTFLGLCSHEYFHTWHVKRIKPAVFIPYDLTKENYTRLLWVFEGITSYYDDLALVRAELISPESYLSLLSHTITRVLQGSGRLKQNLADSSFDAWTKFYQQDENAPNAIVSYYAKGSLVALALDLTLRRDTQGKCSLDTMIKVLWQSYGKTGKGLPEIGEIGIEQMTQRISGLDLSTFFDHALRSTEDLDLESLFQWVGIHYQLYYSNKKEEQPSATLGIKLTPKVLEAKISQVFDHSAAQLGGMAAGDTIIAVDGIKATAENLENLIAAYPVGATITFHSFRIDVLHVFQVVLKPTPKNTCILSFNEQASSEAMIAKKFWLN